MSDVLAELEARLRRLEDLNAIKDLKARYLNACDLRKPDDVLDCLSPKGAVIAYEGFPAFDNREAFVQVFREMGCQPGVFDMHHGANPEIEFDGADRATGKWALYFHSVNLAERTVLQMGCEYDDEYVRANGRWWIQKTATRRTSFLMQSVDDTGAAKVVVLGESSAAFGAKPN